MSVSPAYRHNLVIRRKYIWFKQWSRWVSAREVIQPPCTVNLSETREMCSRIDMKTHAGQIPAHPHRKGYKLAPYETDGRSTPTYCQLQSHVTQKLRQKSKIRPRQALGSLLPPNWRIRGHLPAPVINGEEIAFKNGQISDLQGLLTLTVTLDRLILHTVMHHSSTST